MPDDFLTKKKCDRCGGLLTTRILSMFNLDVLCPECKEKETQHPDYKRAQEAELNEVKKGNFNFAGIGYPSKKRRLFYLIDRENNNEKRRITLKELTDHLNGDGSGPVHWTPDKIDIERCVRELDEIGYTLEIKEISVKI